MANKTNYGLISDIHKDPRIVATAIDVLKKEGTDKLLVNGDIGETQETLQDSQNYVAFVLDIIGKSGLEAYVQPGSHETFGAFSPVLDAMSERYPNLIDTIKTPSVDGKNHRLVFLPGSDWNAGGEYTIGNQQEIPTGTYIKTQEGLIKFFDFDQYIDLIQQGVAQGILHYQNMADLKGRVSDPDKTIVVCHVPRKFDNIDICVDMAYFAEKPDGSLMPGVVVENIIRQQVGNVPYDVIEKIAKENNFTFKHENSGNEDLRDLYQELGLTKAINGHFHESGHRANDSQGNAVFQGQMVAELFWNSGHLDVGQTGILTVGDGKVSYRNINLQNLVK